MKTSEEWEKEIEQARKELKRELEKADKEMLVTLAFTVIAVIVNLFVLYLRVFK